MAKTPHENFVYGLTFSPHFTGRQYRCKGYEKNEPCGCKGAVLAHPDLVAFQAQARAHFGWPIQNLTAFRCKEWNTFCKGDRNSVHKLGCAADQTSFEIANYVSTWRIWENKSDQIRVFPGDLLDRMANVLISIVGPERGNIIVYPDNGFIHADVWDRMAPTGHLIRVKYKRKTPTPYIPVSWAHKAGGVV